MGKPVPFAAAEVTVVSLRLRRPIGRWGTNTLALRDCRGAAELKLATGRVTEERMALATTPCALHTAWVAMIDDDRDNAAETSDCRPGRKKMLTHKDEAIEEQWGLLLLL